MRYFADNYLTIKISKNKKRRFNARNGKGEISKERKEKLIDEYIYIYVHHYIYHYIYIFN
jgi:hypothetical protein